MSRRECLVMVICALVYLGSLSWVFHNYSNQQMAGSSSNQLEELEKKIDMSSRQMEVLLGEVSKLRELENSNVPPVVAPVATTDAPVVPVDVPASGPVRQDQIGILVISCNRPDISRSLDKILKARPKGLFPIIVSQDCGDENTARVVQTYDEDVIHIRQPDLGPIANLPADHRHFEGYYKISRHYKWALTEVFDALLFNQVIIIEDDLEIAPDFFDYFLATLPLLRSDPTLMCVSAWNDNGKAQFIEDPEALYRSDFFPGLGWMLTKELWRELKPKWPGGFWDDWLREPQQRQNRACIRPEISRTYTFGRIGASNGQYFETHLQYIVLNSVPVDFKTKDMSYLAKDKYDPNFLAQVEKAEETSISGVQGAEQGANRSFKITYGSNTDFESLASQLGLMSDLRAGVPRGAYLGIVPFKFRGNAVYLVPQKPWAGYVP